jgi:hypothetical protein
MSRKLGYKDVGDRVIIRAEDSYGQHGEIVWHDDAGLVGVDLDNGVYFVGYNIRDMVYETKLNAVVVQVKGIILWPFRQVRHLYRFLRRPGTSFVY